MPQKPSLTVREIVFGVGAGAIAAAVAAALLYSNDAPPTGPRITISQEQTYQVAQFDELSTIGPQNVVVTIGDTQSIRAEGDAEGLALLETVVENGRLIIRPRDRSSLWSDWSELESATFYVTVPRLEAISLDGSGDVTVDRIEGQRFTGTVSGSGELAIAALRVDQTDLSVAGSGDLSAASGNTRVARLKVEGSGMIAAEGLRSEDATVDVEGSGDASLTVDGNVDISITGSGDVDIAGPAQCKIARSGSGDVSCGGAEAD